MSTHCHRYPSCGCPREMGYGCHVSDDSERKKLIERIKSGKTVLKTDGNSNTIEVPNPDGYIRLHKRRRRVTNLTQPKKKRKKR